MTGKCEYWLFIFHSTVNGHSLYGGRKGEEGKFAIILKISVLSTIYRLRGGNLGIAIFETDCSLVRAQGVRYRMA